MASLLEKIISPMLRIAQLPAVLCLDVESHEILPSSVSASIVRVFVLVLLLAPYGCSLEVVFFLVIIIVYIQACAHVYVHVFMANHLGLNNLSGTCD